MKTAPLAIAALRHASSAGHPSLALPLPASAWHGTLPLEVRRKREPASGMPSQKSKPIGSATAMNGLRRPLVRIRVRERERVKVEW